jgi:hypothetical protein
VAYLAQAFGLGYPREECLKFSPPIYWRVALIACPELAEGPQVEDPPMADPQLLPPGAACLKILTRKEMEAIPSRLAPTLVVGVFCRNEPAEGGLAPKKESR